MLHGSCVSGRKSTLALLCKQKCKQCHAHHQQLAAVYVFRYKNVVIHDKEKTTETENKTLHLQNLTSASKRYRDNHQYFSFLQSAKLTFFSTTNIFA